MPESVPSQESSGYLEKCCLFAIVPVLVLFYWRGVWVLLDTYAYPLDFEATAWCSFVLGYGGILLMFLGNRCRDEYFAFLEMVGFGKESLIATGLDRLHTFFAGFFVVNAWRFIWYWQDLYLLPSDPLLSAWVSASVGAVCLLLLAHFKSVLAPPVLLLRDDADLFAPSAAAEVGRDDGPVAGMVAAAERGLTSGKGNVELGDSCERNQGYEMVVCGEGVEPRLSP
jgi:hypothetical protein